MLKDVFADLLDFNISRQCLNEHATVGFGDDAWIKHRHDTAVVVGAVHFVLYLLAGAAARKAHRTVAACACVTC